MYLLGSTCTAAWLSAIKVQYNKQQQSYIAEYYAFPYCIKSIHKVHNVYNNWNAYKTNSKILK